MRKKIIFLLNLTIGISLFSIEAFCSEKITVGVVTPGKYETDANCAYHDRTTVEMGGRFGDELCNKAQVADLIFHYKNKNAWKNDMKSGVNTLNVDDVDLAMFCGHGLKKGSDGKGNIFNNNSIHFYASNSSSNMHKTETETNANLNVTEANWGGGSAKTKWVVVYACNFLNPVDGTYKLVLNGVHQVLGFSTTMYITQYASSNFAYYLYQGVSIRDSFFWSTIDRIGPEMRERCVANVLCAKQSVEDTIYDYSSKPSPWGRGGTYYEFQAVIRAK